MMIVARSLARRPTYALLAIALLGLGVGAVSAIFALVDVALLRPLPYPAPDRLEALKAVEPEGGGPGSAYGLAAAQFVRWRDEARAFAAIEGLTPKSISLVGTGDPEALSGMQVSAGLFSLLGGSPERGRAFTRDEEFTGSPVAIVSHELWQQRLDSDPRVLDRSLVLDGVSRKIVGVMPPDFSVLFERADVWIPLPLEPAQRKNRLRAIITVGRLGPGANTEQATAELNRICDEIASEIAQFRHTRARVVPLRQDLFGATRAPLQIIVAAVLVLLLIACANVLNLTFSDALARRQTTMIRLALGGSPSRIIGARAVEAVMITAIAAAVGLVLGRLALASLAAADPRYFTDFGDLSLNLRTLTVTAVTAAIAGGVSIIPVALSEARIRIASVASTAARAVGNRGDHRLREILLAAQVMLALVLLLAGAVLGKNLRALGTAPQGFSPNGLVAIKFTIPAHHATSEGRALYLRRLVNALESVPGVADASVTQGQFSVGSSSQSFFAVAGQATADSTGVIGNIRHVMPGVFAVAGTRIVEGRGFDDTDRHESRPVAVVSRSFARQRLGDRAIGARIRRTARPEFQWMEVVGVAEDVKDAGLGIDLGPTVWIDAEQENESIFGLTMLVRMRDSRLQIGRALQEAIWRVDPTQPLNRVATVEELERESAAEPRFQALVVTLFAANALLLVIGGIYALTLYSVLGRTREIGVRCALGATPVLLVGESAWRGLRPLAIGVGMGALAAVPALSLMQRSLNRSLGIEDAPLLVGIVLVLGVTAAIAAAIPARRATRVSPLEAMRY